jgi:hypothetical protein
MPNIYQGATFSVTPLGEAQISFGDLNNLNERSALNASMGNPEYDYAEWHIAGTDGDVVCNLGNGGRTVVCSAIYIGEYPAILTTFESDKISMAGKPCVVVDTAGQTHNRCRLKVAKELAPPKGTVLNDDAVAFFIAQFLFDVHGETA